MGRALLVTSGSETGIGAQLEAASWIVEQVSAGEAETRPSQDVIDLVVCPLHLGGGTDGAALLSRLRRIHPHASALLTAETLAAGESQHLSDTAGEVPLIRVPATPELLAIAVSAAS